MPVAATAVAPARRFRTLKFAAWGLVAAVIAALVIGGIALASHGGGERSMRAKQGDCLSGEQEKDLKRVGCDDTRVRWTVVGVVTGRTEADAKKTACSAWPQAEASYWESRNGKTGFVLCLASAAGQ
jgi:hypothetical protein